VQGTLQDALGVLVRADPPRVQVAGRTDAGVHARGQVAHVDLPDAVAADPLLLRRLNGLLPEDVRSAGWRGARRLRRPLLGACRAPTATAWPTGRSTPTRCAARRPDVARPLDVAAMTAACAPLLGEHDFAAFCKRREGATTVRALLALSWEREPDGLLVLTVRADAFCHSMVRSLVGAMLAVGDGRRPPEWPGGLLARSARADDVAVAPPHGLVLEHVAYPPDHQLRARQEVTRHLRA
jgi:tRNA pseudouridine38-40 synthase